MTSAHPLLGYDRQLSAVPLVCSKCCHEIDDDAVPLIVWGAGDLAWVFCKTCESPILSFLLAKRDERAP